ncbi:MAG: hypothetical protein ACOYOK_14915 [Pseudobdellovibrionaceae bacterium]
MRKSILSLLALTTVIGSQAFATGSVNCESKDNKLSLVAQTDSSGAIYNLEVTITEKYSNKTAEQLFINKGDYNQGNDAAFATKIYSPEKSYYSAMTKQGIAFNLLIENDKGVAHVAFGGESFDKEVTCSVE